MSKPSRRQALSRMAMVGAAAPLWLSGCGGEKSPDANWEDDTGALGPIPTEPDLKDLAVDANLVNGINGLGWNLLQKLKSPNPFISAAGLGISLGMLEAGADGLTREELRKALSLPAAGGIDGASWKTLAQFLRVNKPKRQLQLANAVFMQSGYDFAPDFQKQLKESFLTQSELVDFRGAPQHAAQAIDQWVAKRLRQPFRKTANQEGITPLTRLVLVNLVHFKGEWDQRFDAAMTKEGTFETAPGQSKAFPFMNLHQGEFQINETEQVRAIRLPFKGKDRALHAILPKKRHGLNELLQAKGVVDWDAILFDLFGQSVLDVSIPKFLMKSELMLQAPLQRLGVTTVFDQNTSNLSRMTGTNGPLYVQAIVQQTQFLMNEEGAKAAAITRAPAWTTSKRPRKDDPFVANQPFLVALTDSATKSILFLGRVDDPQPILENT